MRSLEEKQRRAGEKSPGQGVSRAGGVQLVRSSGSSGWGVNSEPGNGAPGRGLEGAKFWKVWHVTMGTGYSVHDVMCNATRLLWVPF